MKKDRNSVRLCTALLAAILTVCPLSGCGDDETLDAPPAQTTALSEESEEETGDTEEESENKDDDSDSDHQAEGEVLTPGLLTEEGSKPPVEGTTPQSQQSEAEGQQSQSAQTQASQAQSQSVAGSSQTSKSTTTTATTSHTTPTTSATEETPAVKETKYIYLKGDTAQYQGTGITVSGNTIAITKGGTYQISGTLSNGQIYIMTDDKKVYLQLAGCDITNPSGSAINCQQVKKLTIQTLPGTVNTISDGGTHEVDDGAIFTEDTIIFEGEGVLNVNGNYAHGIQSDDDIIINSGIMNIKSTKSGLHCNDGIDINGGTLFCDGGTNGIKTDGYININGGESILIGGVREEKGAIYCDGTFTVNGGTIYAIGNTCTMPDNSACCAAVMGAIFPTAQPANTLVQFAQGGNTIAAFTSPRSFKYAVYAGPNLNVNTEYTVNCGGAVSGGTTEHFVTKGGSVSGGTECGKIFTGSVVTFQQLP